MAGSTTDQEIGRMVLNEADPKHRALLLVLLQMNKSLEANTSLTGQIASEFTAHKEEYHTNVTAANALINRAVGGWKTIGIAMGICTLLATAVYALSAYIVNRELRTLQDAIVKNEQQDKRLSDLETNQIRRDDWMLLLQRLSGIEANLGITYAPTWRKDR